MNLLILFYYDGEDWVSIFRSKYICSLVDFIGWKLSVISSSGWFNEMFFGYYRTTPGGTTICQTKPKWGRTAQK